MRTIYDDADFDELSWHDCSVWRFELRVGDSAEEDWTADLLLDLDFIADGFYGTDGTVQYAMAPATLSFQGVTDLKMTLDFGDSGFQTAIHAFSVDRIEREPVRDQKVYLDRTYYRWTIFGNWPQSGDLSFGAVGFTLKLACEPITKPTYTLSLQERARLSRR
ncbi:MAG TPA: hypothetical protein VGN12_08670 [Pirellulales bacterium]|jgi:hypothetical protein